jgi:hypothetical protein
MLDCVWNVMAHAQKPDFVFRRNRRVHLKRQGRQFSRLLAAEVCASAVVMLDTPCSVVVWRVLATHSIRQFPLHFPSRASPCAITFQTQSTIHPSTEIKNEWSYTSTLPYEFKASKGILLFTIKYIEILLYLLLTWAVEYFLTHTVVPESIASM